ncbi:MAG: hypothetical protein JWR86_1074 [Enterovirga sp.]|jgi:branched-chain amino acid transport system substrate-binding protein|nr:hypothetical protein [Enterovirga sp.]
MSTKALWASAFLAAAMLSPAAAQSQQPPVLIGVVGDFSGPVAPYSTAALQGAQVALDELNAAGGINGQRIQLRPYDDRNDPVEGATIAKRLGDEVLSVIVTSGSSPALSMGPVLNRAGLPFITTLSSNPAVTESGWKYANRLHLSDRHQIERIIQHALDTDKLTKIAILYDTSDLGVGGRNIALKTLEKRSVKPLVVEGWKQTDADFSSQLIKLKSAGVEGVIIWGAVEGAVRIAQQMRALALDKVQIYGGGGLVSQKFIDLGGSAVEGTIATWAYLDTSTPIVTALEKTFESRFKSKLDIFGAQGYDALRILAQAISTAGTKPSDRPKILEAIRSMKYQGAVGEITFGPDGENIRKIYIARLKAGKFSVLD